MQRIALNKFINNLAWSVCQDCVHIYVLEWKADLYEKGIYS